MTTPNQPSPDGAYVIGGGGNSYGQELNDASAAHLMLGGFTSIASIGNPLDAVGAAMGMFAQALLKLPLDVLKLFEPLIPGDLGAVFNTVGGAVNAIMGFFQTIGPLLTSTFNSFITTSYNILSSAFQQILDIVNGLLVTPINSAVSGFKDWFTGLMGSTLPDLGTAVSGAVNQVSDLIHNLLTAPSTVLGNIPQTLVTGLNGALNDVNGFVNGVVNAIISAIRGIPFVGGSIADALAALTGAVSDNNVNQQNATITLASSGDVNETWKCRYQVADITYPEIMHNLYDIQGTSGPASAGTAHTHDVGAAGAIAFVPSWLIAKGSLWATYLGAKNSIVYDTVGLYAGATAAINNVFVEVFRQDAAGGLNRVYSKDVSSLLVTTNQTPYVETSITPPIIAQAGERFMVSLRNSTTNTANAVFKGLENDATLGFSVSDSTYTNTTYTPTQVAANGGKQLILWAMLAAKNWVRGDQSFSDDFNRVALGSLYYPVSNTGANQIGITSNRLAFKGTTNGDQIGLHIDAMSGDQMQVEANIYDRIATPRIGVMTCCNRELTQTVYLGVNASTANLYTGAWNSLTQRASVSVAAGDAKWGVYNDPSASKFYIIRDGTDVGSWVDSGGVVQLGPDYRFGGARISRASSLNGGTLDNFTQRDYAR